MVLIGILSTEILLETFVARRLQHNAACKVLTP